MKPEERDIREVMGLDDEGIVAFYVKGHRDAKKFEEEVSAYALEQFGVPDKVTITHEQWRLVPMNTDAFSSRFVQGTGRGSFPVTVATIREWDR